MGDIQARLIAAQRQPGWKGLDRYASRDGQRRQVDGHDLRLAGQADVRAGGAGHHAIGPRTHGHLGLDAAGGDRNDRDRARAEIGDEQPRAIGGESQGARIGADGHLSPQIEAGQIEQSNRARVRVGGSQVGSGGVYRDR